MPESRPFLSSRVRLAGMVDVFLMLGLAGSWLGMLGKWHWGLDLFSHFRWQYLAVCLLALAWAGWQRRRVVLGISLATLVLNMALIAGSGGWRTVAGKPVEGFGLRVVSLNVLTSNPNHAAVLESLRQADADVIFLMEVDRVWARALQPLRATHPHHLIQPQSDNFGLALFSRVPLEELRILTSGELETGSGTRGNYLSDSVEVRLKSGGRELTLIGIHPIPPISGAAAKDQEAQLRGLAMRVAGTAHPVLLVGDFNATPWSHQFHVLTEVGRLQPSPGAWKPTWRAGSVFALPIDQAMTTAPLVIDHRSIGPDVGSDHRAQIIDLGWTQ